MNNSSIISSLIVLGVFVFVLVILFLILREVVTWYWKINQAISLLTKIEENTRKHSIGKVVEAGIVGVGESKMEPLKASTVNIPDAELIELIERIQPSKDKTQIPFLIECLHHNNSDVRWQAADALGEIQDVIALKTLKPLLSDPDTYVREHVKKAIDKITGAKTAG